MTSRERVLTAMRRKEPDRTPHDMGVGLTPGQQRVFEERTGQTDAAKWFGADVRAISSEGTRVHTDFSKWQTDLPERATVDEWGIGNLPTESDAPEHAHLSGFVYPLAGPRTVGELREYPLPDIDAPYRYEGLSARVRACQEAGYAATVGMECTIFEIAWYMRSMEGLFEDMLGNPSAAGMFLDRITEKRVAQARLLASSGADVIRTGDDVATQRGMMMSLPMWRRWLKPRLAEVIAAAKKANPDILVFYHSDGAATPIIPDLIGIGVDILNPIQVECMDPVALKREFGADIAFWGSIGTQTTLPFGTPEDVRREVRTRIETMGTGGGLLLGPTHYVEPDVPWENLLAFKEAVTEG